MEIALDARPGSGLLRGTMARVRPLVCACLLLGCSTPLRSPPPQSASASAESCAPQGPADAVLRRYAAAVEARDGEIEPDMSVSELQREVWSRVAPAAREVLWPERALLHRHAAWELQSLPRQALPELDGWTAKDHALDRAPAEALRNEVRRHAAGDEELGTFVLAWSAVRTYGWLRFLTKAETLGALGSARHTLLESFAPAKTVRLNDDPERPLLATVKANEIFTVQFAFDATSSAYLPEKVTWLVPARGTASEVRDVPPQRSVPPPPETPVVEVEPRGVCAAPADLNAALASSECDVAAAWSRAPLPPTVEVSLETTALKVRRGGTAVAIVRFVNRDQQPVVLDFDVGCGSASFAVPYDAGGTPLRHAMVCQGLRRRVSLAGRRDATIRAEVEAVDERTARALARGSYPFKVFVHVGAGKPLELAGSLEVR